MSSVIECALCVGALLLVLLASALDACGGEGGATAPVTEAHTWSSAQNMLNARFGHTATLLPSGKVLIAAGESANLSILASAELCDQSTGNWTATASMSTARIAHSATLLPDGEVLVAGGSTTAAGNGPTDS